MVLSHGIQPSVCIPAQEHCIQASAWRGRAGGVLSFMAPNRGRAAATTERRLERYAERGRGKGRDRERERERDRERESFSIKFPHFPNPPSTCEKFRKTSSGPCRQAFETLPRPHCASGAFASCKLRRLQI